MTKTLLPIAGELAEKIRQLAQEPGGLQDTIKKIGKLLDEEVVQKASSSLASQLIKGPRNLLFFTDGSVLILDSQKGETRMIALGSESLLDVLCHYFPFDDYADSPGAGRKVFMYGNPVHDEKEKQH